MPVEAASVETGAADAPGPGAMLRDARRGRGLSVEEVAESLHLEESQVQALEAGRFDALGAPVFVRGHLKAYARVLGVSAEPLLDAYGPSQPPENEVVVQSRAPARSAWNLSPGPWAMGAVGLLLALGLAFYVLQDGPAPLPVEVEPAPVAAREELPAPVDLPPRPAPEALPAPAAEPAAERSSAEAAGEPATLEPLAPPLPAAEQSASPAPAERQLELYFREESWAEISDARRRILFGLQREGMRRRLSGEPPFQVLLGNASGVDVYLDGEAYTLPPRSQRGKVARFTIDGDESAP